MTIAEFKRNCQELVDSLGPEGLILTKRGRPVARVIGIHGKSNLAPFIAL